MLRTSRRPELPGSLTLSCCSMSCCSVSCCQCQSAGQNWERNGASEGRSVYACGDAGISKVHMLGQQILIPTTTGSAENFFCFNQNLQFKVNCFY